MSATISDGITSITPTQVDGYEAARQGRNKLHEPIDSPSPYVSILPAATREGHLALVFADEGAAHECVRVHTAAAMLVLTAPERPALNMAYVVRRGDITIKLDDETRAVWAVTIPFREVLP